MAAIHGVIGTAVIFSIQASMSVSLAFTAIRIFCLFLSPPIRALNTIRVSLTRSRALVLGCKQTKELYLKHSIFSKCYRKIPALL